MIIDNLANLHRYAYVPNVQKAVDFIKNNDLSKLEVGKYDLGDDCVLKVSTYETKELNEDAIQFEAHREYLDLQLITTGEELFMFQALDLGENSKEYNPVKDIEFFTTSWYNTVVLNDKNFALIFPNDLHVGGYDAEVKSSIKKFVFKLKI